MNQSLAPQFTLNSTGVRCDKSFQSISVGYFDFLLKVFESLNVSEQSSSDIRAKVSHWAYSNFENQPYLSKEIEKSVRHIFSNDNCSDLDQAYVSEGDYPVQLKLLMDDIPFPSPLKSRFKFIDLFAGVGGFRQALQSLDGRCVFSSEWDPKAQETYFANYGEVPFGDITKVDEKDIPDHDLLCAGFPCQAFSVAGYRKGFADEKGRGNLFFDIYRILKEKKPKLCILENVKNLIGHDKGNTLRVITEYLNEAGYSIDFRVLNTMDYSDLPQNRERIFIVGRLNDSKVDSGSLTDFNWPKPVENTHVIREFLADEADEYFYYNKYSIYPQIKDFISSRDTVYQWRRVYVRENKKGVCPTLTANMGTGGHNVPLILDSKGIRKLTPRECFKVQGFPSEFVFPDIAYSHLYKQAGNSVSVPVVKSVCKSLLEYL